MTIRSKVLILILTLLSAGNCAYAQRLAIGSFQSFKGAGVSVENLSANGRDFYSFSLYSDLAGVYLGNKSEPGVKFNFSHNLRIVDFQPRSIDDLCLFAGPGFTAGWVSDSGREGYGLCGALSGVFGSRAVFSCGVVFTLGMTLETGALIFNENGHVNSALYRDGIYHTVLPHLTISYLFR